MQYLQMSPIPGPYAVSWLSTTGPSETMTIAEHAELFDLEAKELRRRARAIDDRLAGSDWRAMEVLPVHLVDTLNFDAAAYREATPLEQRAVQVLAQHGELIVRIFGVDVLERHPIDEGMMDLAFRVYADRETGSALVIFFDCAGDSCTCDPQYTAQLFHWAPETFAAVDRRPCVADETNDCGPTEFEVEFEPFFHSGS
jgi:hypothetical protein